jgi:hypothetical protein
MDSKTLDDYTEILASESDKPRQFNTRLSKDSLYKFHYIMLDLQSSNIGRLSKQDVIEYIINEQFARMNEQPKRKTYVDQLIAEHRQGR